MVPSTEGLLDELRKCETRYRTTLDSMSDAIHVVDEDLQILLLNRRFRQWCEELGLATDVEGKSLLEVFPFLPPSVADEYRQVFEDGEVLCTEEHVEIGGKELVVEARKFPATRNGRIESVVTVVRDITDHRRVEEDRRQLEAQMQHADKLKSLGVLAGGVAHDFNNLLTAILGNAGLALALLAPGTDAHRCVEQIRAASLRAAEITNQMLAYSGQSTFVVEPVDLSRLAKEMARLLHTCISKKVSIEYDLQPDLPAIEADAGQIRQVVMNLITNAAEAIGDQTGTVTVRTGVMEVDEAYPLTTWTGDDLEPGPYVVLEVSDTGCGMSPETQSRVFEPFFTTKFTGRGLGLASVLGIVRGHDGAVEVESASGVGTTFRVLFPYTGVSPAPFDEQAANGSQWQGEGTILVVDDEEGVRDVMQSVLERCGLQVLTATNGRDGLAVFAEHSHEIAAVILDLTMPRMNGEEALREIRKLQPDARVILTSGFGEQEAAARFAAENIAGFVKKPFKLDELIDTVREALEGEC